MHIGSAENVYVTEKSDMFPFWQVTRKPFVLKVLYAILHCWHSSCHSSFTLFYEKSQESYLKGE